MYLTRTIYFTALCFFLLISNAARSQHFQLVKDINTVSHSRPSGNNMQPYESDKPFTTLNNTSYFVAEDGIHGSELWRTDGTANGTYLLKDIYTGTESSNISYITAFKNGIIFSATNGGENKLWISNGTEAGTKEMGNFSSPQYIMALGEKFYFISKGQLYSSDGTADGTVSLFNFFASTKDYYSARVNRLYVINNKLFLIVDYTTPESNHAGPRLWVSNGTVEGTMPISNDIVAPDQLITGPDGMIYFSSQNYYESQRKLWVTNGQPGNMQKVAAAGDIIVRQGDFIKTFNDAIYFAGNKANNFSDKLYKLQGNQLSLVKDFEETGQTASISNVKKVTGGLYLGVSFLSTATTYKRQLWKSDGSTNGTLLVKDSCLMSTSIEWNGKLLFYAVGPDRQNREPWISDGTEAGTAQLKDIAPGINGSDGNFTVFSPLNHQLIFQANDGPSGLELWQTNGTAAGTTLLKDINTTSTGPSGIWLPTAFNNKLVFTASNGINGGLWASDGTDAGTTQVNNISFNGLYKQSITTYARLKDELYADGYDSLQAKYGLIKSNGNSTNGELVKAFDRDKQLIVWVRATSNLVYFELFNSTDYTRFLWRSDGTTQGTYSVTQLLNEVVFDTYNNIYPTAVDSVLYFLQKDDNSRSQLWKTDGTIGGTALVTAISQEFDPQFSNFMAFNGFLYFSAKKDYVRQLFRTRGQQEAIEEVKNNFSTTGHFTVSGGQLYFSAYLIEFNSSGTELWRINPSTDSVYLVKTISPTGNPSPNQLVNVDGNVFFFANDGVHGQELWKTDGTEQGTKLVKDITPGAASSLPGTGNNGPYTYTAAISGKLFFKLNDTLWVSDGTDTGTVKVKDDGLAGVQYFRNFVAVDNRLYFVATTYTKGEELYSGIVPSAYRTTYTFTGTGYITNAGNWTDGQKPPTEIPKGVEVIIAPGAGGECIIDFPLIVKGGKLTIAKNAKVTFLSK